MRLMPSLILRAVCLVHNSFSSLIVVFLVSLFFMLYCKWNFPDIHTCIVFLLAYKNTACLFRIVCSVALCVELLPLTAWPLWSFYMWGRIPSSTTCEYLTWFCPFCYEGFGFFFLPNISGQPFSDVWNRNTCHYTQSRYRTWLQRWGPFGRTNMFIASSSFF